ncbi:MAG: phosphatase PAP2 family protein [Methylococcales bacterium]|nr:phosphatase PAP2 family protein [Methylococcales bacterium]
MNIFDLNIITYINQFSQNSWAFDKTILFLSNSNLLKGGVLVTIIWWAWFKIDERQSLNREHLTSTLLCCFLAILVGRVLALTLPFRLRPFQEESLVFLIPYGMEETILEGWTSFPSDHAVYFFALSTGLLFVSRKVGAFALAYTTLFICLPRIYLGMHYPTDIIAGAVIGMTIASLGNISLVHSKSVKLIINWSLSKPHFFYPLFFILTYQITNMFEDVRNIGNGVYKLFQSGLI